jgi:ribosomal protein L6P/L9E
MKNKNTRKNMKIIVENSPEIDNNISTEQIIELVVKEPTIHDKYREFINQAINGYLRGFEYPMAMEVLRYCEKITGHQIPLNMGCGSCLLDLVLIFARLEK